MIISIKHLERIILDDKTTKEAIEVYNKKGYYGYLMSRHWSKIKEIIFERLEKKCEKCGSEKTLQVHHTSYEDIFFPDPNKFKILCKECHSKTHDYLEVCEKMKTNQVRVINVDKLKIMFDYDFEFAEDKDLKIHSSLITTLDNFINTNYDYKNKLVDLCNYIRVKNDFYGIDSNFSNELIIKCFEKMLRNKIKKIKKKLKELI